MLDVLHFHPNGLMSKKFVSPLLENEKIHGLRSRLINSTNGECSIKYDLNFKNLLFLPISFLKIIKLLKEASPHILISHNSKSSLLPLLAGKLCRIKRVVYFNHGVPFLGHKGAIGFLLYLIERLNCFLADEIITVSSDMKEALKKMTQKKIRLIHNGSACGIDLSETGQRSNEFRSNLGFKETDFLVAFIGRAEKRKGYDLALKMWEKYFANREGFNLLIYGGKQNKPKKFSSIKNLHFMGFSKNIPSVLSNIDCLILPSFHEGLSYIALEAIINKCPVLSNDIPGIRNVVNNEKTGLLIKKNEISEYAKSILKLKSKDYGNLMANEEIELVKRMFNRSDFMIDYIKFIKSS